MVKNVCRVYHSAERSGDICGVFPFGRLWRTPNRSALCWRWWVDSNHRPGTFPQLALYVSARRGLWLAHIERRSGILLGGWWSPDSSILLDVWNHPCCETRGNIGNNDFTRGLKNPAFTTLRPLNRFMFDPTYWSVTTALWNHLYD